MDVYVATLVFVFGALVGSFLNVIVLRHGFKEERRSRSGCAACGKKLHWYELVPVLSFFLLRGRCSLCGSKLSPQYPLVELLTATLFLLTFWVSSPFNSFYDIGMFVALSAFWSAFVVLTVYDIKHTLVPPTFSLALIASAIAVRAFEWTSMPSVAVLYDALFGALVFGGFIFFLFLITRGKGMGLGDAHVGVALGTLFGLMDSVEVLALSFWIGAGVGIVLLVLKKGFRMKTEVPFVPFLFLASIVGIFTNFSALAFVSALMYGL
jgi:prepilin signal peptidase PulO-like enzyme (type II secretory pathway)